LASIAVKTLQIGQNKTMNLNQQPYPSNRSPILGARGAVATSQPLAAQAGLEMLKAGGNAVDAAIATAVALTVLEPTSNGIGGDAFALVWDGSKLHGLNASGRAPANTTPELFSARGLSDVPRLGWLPVTVPGAPSAWRELHAKFGKLEFEALFQPAIFYAQNGYPVSPTLAQNWGRAARVYSSLSSPEFLPWMQTFTRNGLAPKAGEMVVLPDHAHTLALIAKTRAQAFYEGELAERIEDFAAQTGGFITRADLQAHTADWVEPISTNYRGYDVWEIPPNGQGIAALAALNILEGFDLSRHSRDSTDSYHLQIEAMKLAFMDARAYVADPNHTDVPSAGMLDKQYASERRELILETALEPSAGTPPHGGTVYLCTADQDGMMVSYIQSNYAGFGSGIVIPGTGIALQNRGANFNLEPNHPNQIAPGKRPYHTIIPGFLSKDHKAIGPFGVMGGFMQPQGHLQMVVNTIDYDLNPQASLDAPRWQWLEGKHIELELHTPTHISEGLRERGHQITMQLEKGSFGRGQIIWRLNDVLVAASDSRTDGQALAF
jgi:gamma-glutamyltranspeptidase / glutathione hydrolase